MLQAIKQFYDRYLKEGGGETSEQQEHGLRLATAALLIEMMRMDEVIAEEERRAVSRAIEGKFGLTPEETQELVRLADQEVRDATDYHQFTSLINRGFSHERKVRLVEHLWEVALADGKVDPYEEHLVRKIAELLYLSHSDFIAAKHRALAGS